MGKIDKRLRILWLSDIHYNSEYKNANEEHKSYLDSFITYLSNDINKRYDYLLLSGDLAQKGLLEDYELLYKNIIEPIKNLFPKIKLLTVPGNHDLNRNDAVFLEKFINSLPNKKTENIRRSFFNDNRSDFELIFDAYSESIKNWNFPDNELSDLKSNSYLFGYSVDLKNKTVFVLLNSSWYSLGDKILYRYLENKLKIESTIDKNYLKKMSLDIQNIAEEYGRQVLALDDIEQIDKIIKILEKYNDFLVVSVMHHPINWFDMEDRVAKPNSQFQFIKSSTDLLLTGHEHIPKEFQSEYINDNDLLHIQAGCFMYNQKPENFKTYFNWFSTLEINTVKRTVRHRKFSYDDKEKYWHEFKTEKINSRKFKRSYNSCLSMDRLEEFIRNFNVSLLIKRGLIKKECEILRDNYYLRKNFLYIFIENIDFFENFKENIVIIKQYLDLYNVGIVEFKLFDIFHEFREEYSWNPDRLFVLGKIKNDYEKKFNLLRHKFFSELNVTEIKKYSELRLSCSIIPYWYLENYLNS